MDQYRKSPRASFLNYDGGEYFITICTKKSKHFFGNIKSGKMTFSRVGAYLHDQLSRANDFCPDIQIPLFVVMPNHIHAIIIVKGDMLRPESRFEQRSPAPSLRASTESPRVASRLTSYIISLKGAVTKFARTIGAEFAWHGRYYDRLIRNNDELNKIAEYITGNISRWDAEKNAGLDDSPF